MNLKERQVILEYLDRNRDLFEKIARLGLEYKFPLKQVKHKGSWIEYRTDNGKPNEIGAVREVLHIDDMLNISRFVAYKDNFHSEQDTVQNQMELWYYLNEKIPNLIKKENKNAGIKSIIKRKGKGFWL